MNNAILTVLLSLTLGLAASAIAREEPETDVLDTSAGKLKITFIGHGTLMLQFAEKAIHVDPWGQLADYSAMPKADLILVTHDHGDHLDTDAIRALRKAGTEILVAQTCAGKVENGIVMTNGEVRASQGVRIEAVPAYNIVHKRPGGQPFHPRGAGNGYILTFGDRRVYVAGDTENTPEMKALKGIDTAFLPINLPYTMTLEMAADAARALRPKILYPCHYGETDVTKLAAMLKDVPEIEVRIRRMQ